MTDVAGGFVVLLKNSVNTIELVLREQAVFRNTLYAIVVQARQITIDDLFQFSRVADEVILTRIEAC